MENQIKEIAGRIKGLRKIMELKKEDVAIAAGVSLEEYELMESGEEDFSFTFLYKCANYFGVDIAEIITGEDPKLSFYTIVRNNAGVPIKRREGFSYLHKAILFKKKVAEPFFVCAKYNKESEEKEIHLSTHKGQEFDYILKGSLKVRLEDHIEILNEGDSIYYDSSHGHGMVATNGKDCEFLAIVMKEEK